VAFTTQTYKQIAKHVMAAANTEEVLYTVPASSAVIGQIIAVNTSTTLNRTFRVSISSGGGATAAADYLAYDISLAPGESWQFQGATLNAADVVRVYADAISTTAGTGMVFQIYGELNS
jgi:uncharacterized protein YabN with tetrapyrrole methylase and pyrophosphatase domain